VSRPLVALLTMIVSASALAQSPTGVPVGASPSDPPVPAPVLAPAPPAPATAAPAGPAYPGYGYPPTGAYPAVPYSYPGYPAYPAPTYPYAAEVATQPTEIRPEPAPRMPSFSLTLSPILLLEPVLQLNGELRLGDNASITAIAGGGWVKVNETGQPSMTFRMLELGGQLRYYATGSFRRGMQVGVEVLYVNVDVKVEDVAGVASGLAMGPFFGWKAVSRAGFTLDLQGGVAVLTSGQRVSNASKSATDTSVDFIPLINANIGWSF